MTDALVSLGSNQGDRAAALQAAVDALAATTACSVTAVSGWLATVPIGGPADQSEFLNGAVRLETDLSAEALLRRLQEIETSLGRERTVRWGPRPLDLDLLLFGDAQIDRPEVTVPHPRLECRQFVLKPAVEIAGDMIHPRLGWNLTRLFDHLHDSPPWLAVAAEDEASSRAFMERLVEVSPVTLHVAAADEVLAAIQDDGSTTPNPRGPLWPARFWLSPLPEEYTGMGEAAAAAGPLILPRLTFTLGRPPLSWAPCLSLATADLGQAVQEAVAAIEASLPESVGGKAP